MKTKTAVIVLLSARDRRKWGLVRDEMRLVLSNIRSKVVAVLVTVKVIVKIAVCTVFESNSQNGVCDERFYTVVRYRGSTTPLTSGSESEGDRVTAGGRTLHLCR